MGAGVLTATAGAVAGVAAPALAFFFAAAAAVRAAARVAAISAARLGARFTLSGSAVYGVSALYRNGRQISAGTTGVVGSFGTSFVCCMLQILPVTQYAPVGSPAIGGW